MQDYAETNFVEKYQPGEDAIVELRNGRFVDTINGRYFPSGTSVVIKGNKVKAMPGLPGESTNIKPDFAIDLQDKAVFPGLFNTHCHASYSMTTVSPDMKDISLGKKYRQQQLAKNFAECLAHGITNIRDCKIEDLRLLRAWKERISRGEVHGPRIYQAVVVTPPNSYFSPRLTFGWRLFCLALGIPVVEYEKEESGVVVFPLNASERQVRDAVNRAIDERGAECIKIGEQRENLTNFKPTHAVMTAKQLEALADQARRRGLKSTIHQVSVESFRRAVKCGVSTLAHMPRDAALREADVDAFIAAKCISEPTLSVAYDVVWGVKGHPSYGHPDVRKIVEFRDNTIVALVEEFFFPELRGSVLKSHQRLSQGTMKLLGILDATALYRYYSTAGIYGGHNFRLLFEKGAQMGCGNDGGIPPCTPAAIKYEMGMIELLSGDGNGRRFSGADALRLATTNSAQAMGLEDKFGSIEEGKVADLAIVDGDPLTDLHLVGSRVVALFYDGKLKINNCGLRVEPARRA